MATEFLDEKVYENLDAILNEVMDYCLVHKIPFFVTYAKEKEQGEIEYQKRMVTPSNVGKQEKIYGENDKISKFNVALNNNFEIRVKKPNPNIFAGDVFEQLIEDDMP